MEEIISLTGEKFFSNWGEKMLEVVIWSWSFWSFLFLDFCQVCGTKF